MANPYIDIKNHLINLDEIKAYHINSMKNAAVCKKHRLIEGS